MIRALTLVSKPLGVSPGQRFRLEQWAPILRETHNIALDFAVFESTELTAVLYQRGAHARKAALVARDTVRRAQILSLAKDYDVVVIYRAAALLGPALYERALRRIGCPIVYDIDDAIWLQTDGSVNGVFAKLRFPAKTATICRLADGVMVGNDYLAAFARSYSDNVHVVPTTVDVERWATQTGLAFEDPFVITWSGSHTTLAHLEVVRRPLAALGAKRRVRLRIICSRPPERPFAGVETEFIPWTRSGEVETLGATHVGIMPLPDDEFTRGKCGLKALTYMATGRPAVASPVGVNKSIIADGHNGLLAATDDQWLIALETLANSPQMRRELGLAGRKTVEDRFSAPVGAEAAASAIREAIIHRRLNSEATTTAAKHMGLGS